MRYKDEECYGIVYCITNLVNGKRYVGQTIHWKSRLHAYMRMDCKYQPKLHNAFLKHGLASFTFEVIHVAYSKEQLDWLECWFIKEYRCLSNGYNCMSGGSHGKASPDTKAKMSASRLGKVPSTSTRALLSGSNNYQAKPVVCITTGAVYSCAAEAGKATGAWRGDIAKACRGAAKSCGKLPGVGKLQWRYA